ncbi:MAG: glycosyltransferase, partial [Methylococcaceae bacterium]
YYGMPDTALFYFPYAVDNDYLKAQADKSAPTRNSKRQAMGIGQVDFVVLGVLKFVPREDPLTLLAAYTALVKQYPQTHLILVGDGSLMDDITRLVNEQRLTQVHLPGYLPYSDLASYYSLADVFVHPAKVEPWGVSVNEAMACGLPVIVADTVGAGADLIEEGKTGFVYTAGQPELLAGQLEKLIKDPVCTKAMGLRASERVAEWGYAKTLEQTIKALDYVSRRKLNHE